MTWVSVAMGLIVGAGYVANARTQNSSPLAPYAVVGSYASIGFKNYSDDTLRVFVIAPKVDKAIRFMGAVPPHDSVSLRLPYASTKVTLLCFTKPDAGFIFEKQVP